jgi:hypothetical protein
VLRLILAAQGRLRQLDSPPGAKRALAGKRYFAEALRWLEIHGGVEATELAAHWRGVEPAETPADERGERRPRRRRRRRRRPRPDSSQASVS